MWRCARVRRYGLPRREHRCRPTGPRWYARRASPPALPACRWLLPVPPARRSQLARRWRRRQPPCLAHRWFGSCPSWSGSFRWEGLRRRSRRRSRGGPGSNESRRRDRRRPRRRRSRTASSRRRATARGRRRAWRSRSDGPDSRWRRRADVRPEFPPRWRPRSHARSRAAWRCRAPLRCGRIRAPPSRSRRRDRASGGPAGTARRRSTVRAGHGPDRGSVPRHRPRRRTAPGGSGRRSTRSSRWCGLRHRRNPGRVPPPGASPATRWCVSWVVLSGSEFGDYA